VVSFARYRRGWARHGTHETVLRLVPDGMKVLDVGCSTGYLGASLAERSCRVWGLDRDPAAVACLPSCYEDSRACDLDEIMAVPWPDMSFDVAIAADVLEHLRDPSRALAVLRHALKPNGLLVVSLPNVAHLSVRMRLLIGRFDYTETGLLDKTHLRFFTFSTATDLVRAAGFRLERVVASSDRFGYALNRFSSAGRFGRGLLGYGIVIAARAP